MRTIKQCCGDVCNNNTNCEEDAWRRYQAQRMDIYKKLLTNPAILIIIGAVIGFIIGQLL